MHPRRRLLIAFAAGALPLGAFAQQRKIPVIGYMSPVVPENNTDWRFESFVQGMKDLGYVDGQNMRLVVRWGEGKLERMPAIARELVKMKVDVIVASSSPAVLAARDATRTIPIVMPVSSDPVGDGIVQSLAHPGGNITGLSLMAPELGAKRLQLLKQVLKKSGMSSCSGIPPIPACVRASRRRSRPRPRSACPSARSKCETRARWKRRSRP